LLIRDKQILAAAFSEADGRLSVVSESPRKDILTINRAGKVSEYLLTLTVVAEAQNAARDPAQQIQVTLTRSMGYSDAEVLGKQEEEKRLWDDLRREAAGQVIQKFARLKFAPSTSQPSTNQPSTNQTGYQPKTESLKGTP
jgi:LPS-assembly lipoprotein